MPTYTRKGLLLALSAVAVTTTLTTTATATTGAADALPVARAGTAAPVSALAWHPCAQPGGPADQECAQLPVPLDYRHPDGPQIDLAVSRLRSDHPAARRGTLLVIPGGPGSSGVQRLTQKGAALRGQLAGAYDIVSLDPRGVGGSTKASCGLDAGDRLLTTLRSWPAPNGDITENVARSRRTAEACDRNGGAVLRSLTTVNEARDIDRFRQALGEQKLSAWGVSYGTYVAAVYAQKFPEHTDRWVLDSSGDPDPSRVERGWLANMAVGAEDRMPDFAAWAADPARDEDHLRLAQHASEVRPLILSLARTLDREPKQSSTPDVRLTGNMLRQALQNALYDDSSFARLAGLVQAAQDPARTPDLTPDLTQPLSDEDAAVMIGVICNDVSWPGSVASYQKTVATDRAQHPLTAGMTANITPCAFWKDAPTDAPTRITDHGPSNVLMIQNLRDPATPYTGALKMREAFGARARLVSVDHGGHGSYLGNGNACGDRVVTDFFTTGVRPAGDAYCAD
ncbi:alpha/beta hydrolase [Streptomyces sp. NBC_01500]|uniref:alpha/beta hydrolase n=1 Tax=Streptomyces sp. NBC_01500 TaxID=2903886 RepID=UPI002254BAA1|nr:alpha/beta hydrolase [Streptomyces sp. NBC_01500]MCX4549752.1 alpha/beta hydrolase [Streptomyces sp. NBC_01500]